jgi:hypothetical protein
MNNINSIYIYLTPPKKGGVKPIKPYDWLFSILAHPIPIIW